MAGATAIVVALERVPCLLCGCLGGWHDCCLLFLVMVLGVVLIRARALVLVWGSAGCLRGRWLLVMAMILIVVVVLAMVMALVRVVGCGISGRMLGYRQGRRVGLGNKCGGWWDMGRPSRQHKH